MKKHLLKTVCLILSVVLCVGALNAQNKVSSRSVAPINEKTSLELLKNTQPDFKEVLYTSERGNILLSEGFESGDKPEDWIFTNSGTGNPWMVVEGLEDEEGNMTVEPHSGDYFATNFWKEGGQRNAWMFSKGMYMYSGYDYFISFWLMMPGYEDEQDSFELKIGTDATEAGMGTTLYKVTDKHIDDWTKIECTFSPTADGFYYLGFHAFTGTDMGNDIDIDDVKVETFPYGCAPVTNIKIVFENCDKATLTWTAVDGAKGYQILRDGVYVGTTNTNQFVDEDDFINGTLYTWTITTLCDEYATSASAAGCLSINNLANNISITPNPASGTISIHFDNFLKVEVYNTFGQLVDIKNVNTFDVSSYTSGLYLFKVYDTNHNTGVKRILVN